MVRPLQTPARLSPRGPHAVPEGRARGRQRVGSASARRGFTLLELAVALAVAAILSTVAYPAYQQHVTRSMAAEATQALAEGRHQMEQFFLSNRTYTGGPCTASQTVAGGKFTIACPASGAGLPDIDSYIIEATGSGPAAGLKLTIDERGSPRTTAVPSGWAAVPSGGHRCWLLHKGAAC